MLPSTHVNRAILMMSAWVTALHPLSCAAQHGCLLAAERAADHCTRGGRPCPWTQLRRMSEMRQCFPRAAAHALLHSVCHCRLTVLGAAQQQHGILRAPQWCNGIWTALQRCFACCPPLEKPCCQLTLSMLLVGTCGTWDACLRRAGAVGQSCARCRDSAEKKKKVFSHSKRQQARRLRRGFFLQRHSRQTGAAGCAPCCDATHVQRQRE